MNFENRLPDFKFWLHDLLPVGLWSSYLRLQISVSSSVEWEEQCFLYRVMANPQVYKGLTTALGSQNIAIVMITVFLTSAQPNLLFSHTDWCCFTRVKHLHFSTLPLRFLLQPGLPDHPVCFAPHAQVFSRSVPVSILPQNFLTDIIFVYVLLTCLLSDSPDSYEIEAISLVCLLLCPRAQG